MQHPRQPSVFGPDQKLLTWGGKKKIVFFFLFVCLFFFLLFFFFVCFFIFYNKKFDAFQLIRISVLMTVVGLKCIIVYCKCNSLSFILNALSSIQYSCRMNILLLRMVQPFIPGKYDSRWLTNFVYGFFFRILV